MDLPCEEALLGFVGKRNTGNASGWRLGLRHPQLTASGTVSLGMTPMLKPHLLSHLEEFETRMPLRSMALLTDLDGTISPIAPHPQRAAVLPGCRTALHQLSRLLPLVACVSGRPAMAAAGMVDVPAMVYVGNHGLEHLAEGCLVTDQRALVLAPDLAAVASSVQPDLQDGETLEMKGVSLTLHFRTAPNPLRARNRLLSLLNQAIGERALRVREGRMVIEVLPEVPVDKGTATQGLLARSSPGGAVYLGDDRTDVSAFEAVHRWGREQRKPALCVAVESAELPEALLAEADYAVVGPSEVCTFLTWIAERALRRGGYVAG
ncbi:MAG: trehalose-phosphatase [Chloroflexota bacterium]